MNSTATHNVAKSSTSSNNSVILSRVTAFLAVATVLLAASTSNAADRTYMLEIVTGDRAGAGTDSNIFVRLYGTKGTSKLHRLNGLLRGNVFERGDRDRVSLKMEDIGVVTKLTIRSDNKYAGSGWYLERVRVNARGQRPRLFGCYRWLEKGRLSVTLTPARR